MPQASGKLKRMGHIVDYRDSKFAHDGKRTHVHNKVVVAETNAAFSQEKLLATGVLGFLDNVPRILRRQELTLFYIHGPAITVRRPSPKVALPTLKGFVFSEWSISTTKAAFDLKRFLKNFFDLAERRP